MSDEHLPAPAAAPGWYPGADGIQRWWDGERWVNNLPAQPGAAARSQASTSVVGGVVCLAVGLAVGAFGLGWIVIFYLSQGLLPLVRLGSWNILAGLFFWVISLAPFIIGLVLISKARRRRRAQSL